MNEPLKKILLLEKGGKTQLCWQRSIRGEREKQPFCTILYLLSMGDVLNIVCMRRIAGFPVIRSHSLFFSLCCLKKVPKCQARKWGGGGKPPKALAYERCNSSHSIEPFLQCAFVMTVCQTEGKRKRNTSS